MDLGLLLFTMVWVFSGYYAWCVMRVCWSGFGCIVSAWINVVCLLVIVDLISLGLVLLGRFRVFSFGFGMI